MPLDPVTVTLNGPIGSNVEDETSSVADAVPLGLRETAEGDRELVGPKAGET